MTPFSTVNGDFIAVEVPEGAHHFETDIISQVSNLNYFFNEYERDDSGIDYIKLPKADYTFICTSDTITEQQAAEIVEATLAGRKWKDYNGNVLHKTALDSFRSLLASLSITQRVAIFKILK